MGKVSYIKEDLGFPPWAVEWDPLPRAKLYVGGGGGGGQKEVPNKLVCFDAATRESIEPIAEISIPDDSVSSAAVLAHSENGAIVFAGVNDREKKGTHLRTFEIKWEKRRGKEKSAKTKGRISEVARSKFFSETFAHGDGFQRITRLSPVRFRSKPTKRILAIANSLAAEREIVLLPAISAQPASAIQVIKPLLNKEVNDLDIWEDTERPGEFMVAYCTSNDVYNTNLLLNTNTMKPKSKLQEPACVHSSPYPEGFSKAGRPKYRGLRFLGPDLILLLVNIPGGTSELQVLRLFESGGMAELVLRKRLPKSAGQAVSLDVQSLDGIGEFQAIIAIAAQKDRVLVYTFDYSGPNVRATFNLFTDIDTGSSPMKQVRISPFFPPSSTDKPTYIRIASINLTSTLTIDTIPLKYLRSRKRWILQKPGRSAVGGINSSYIVIAFMLVITLFLGQNYYSQAYGSGAAPQLIPQSWADAFSAYRDRAGQMSSPIADRVAQKADKLAHTATGAKILDLLHAHHKDTGHLPDPARKAIILSGGEEGTELSTEVHESLEDVIKADVKAKKWEELSVPQQAAWKQKLKKAGAWSADYGETIFKGVFFSELAGAVGRAAAEAIQG